MPNFQQNSEVNGFVALQRSGDVLQLIQSNQRAFTLATIIAIRARWHEGFNTHGLEVGEALLGDHEMYGLTQQEYRTAKSQLAKWGFATFKSTNAGTVAKLTDERLFSLRAVRSNKQSNKRVTNAQQTPNERATTNEPSNTSPPRVQGCTNQYSAPPVLTERQCSGTPQQSGPVALSERQKFAIPTLDSVCAWIRLCFKDHPEEFTDKLANLYFNAFTMYDWKARDGAAIQDWKSHAKNYCAGIIENGLNSKVHPNQNRGVDRRERHEVIKGKTI